MAQRKAKRPARSIRLITPGVVRITTGKITKEYELREFESEIGGRAFVIHEAGDDDPGYAVLIDGEFSTCDCMGFQHHGHCKHVDGIHKLIECGKL